MKILIVEDDKSTQRLLQRTLEKWGNEVACADNGVEALNLLKKEVYPIVITDWVMPELDGPGLVQEIRQNANSDYVYVIMLTSKSTKPDIIAGMDAGADDFLAKPFDPDELRVRVRAGQRLVKLKQELEQRNIDLLTANIRMKRDLSTAAEIQKSLLPANRSPRADLNIAWRFQPCDELAGDILNFFELDEKTIGFYVLDVSGHGVAASLLSVTLSRMLSPIMDDTSLLKAKRDTAPFYHINSPEEVANQLNRRFQVDAQNEQFFTMLYGVVDMESRKLTYASAGHPGIIYLSDGQPAEVLQAPSLPIGFISNPQYHQQTLDLNKGDRVFLFSDGLIEARSADARLFGMSKMSDNLAASAGLPIEQTLDNLLEAVRQWTGGNPIDDDVSVMAFEFL